MKKYLCHFMPHQNRHLIKQADSVAWLIQYHGAEHADLFRKYAVKPAHIQARAVYAPGTATVPPVPRALYKPGEPESPDMLSRAELAQPVAQRIFADLFEADDEAPAHINHVSCTHYASPSAAQRLVVDKGWHESTGVTHLYHMGCYAAFPALRVSEAYVENGAPRVDVVHTELCSFHLDKQQLTPAQIIMKTLFGDGAIRYSVVNEAGFERYAETGYQILARHERLVPGTENEMSWMVGPTGFVMTLTKNVPLYLARIIEEFMRALFSRAGLDYERDKERALFAVHPGGPKIVESIARVLELSPHQVRHALDILRTRGNMSSASVPYILHHMLNDRETPDHDYVAAVAFGPGLTITGALLKLCRR